MVELSLNYIIPDGKFSISDAAANRIAELIKLEDKADQAIQIRVLPGGCAGHQYDMSWVPKTNEGVKFENNGSFVIIKEADMRFLNNGELDYVESLMGSKFDIKNPNATSTCGCGKSWA